jgi:dihydrofolate reductase
MNPADMEESDPKPVRSIIAALSRNGVIGSCGKIPWHVPEDMRRFKATTYGHPIIMGRKTYESIGSPLPGRINIVLTRNLRFEAPGCRIVHSIDEAESLASRLDKDEIFFIGGGDIFGQVIKKVKKLYLTIIEKEISGDTFFPDYSSFRRVILKDRITYGDTALIFLILEK